MSTTASYDVIVIGSGATGIWTARRLAAEGLSVLIVEAGGPEPAEPSEEGIYSFPKGRPYQRIISRGLGGRTKTWGRVCLRMSDLDFRAPAFDSHGDCWPISSADLSSHYGLVESAFKVHGQQDHLTQIPDGNFIHCDATSIQNFFNNQVRKHWKNRPVTVGRLAHKDFVPLLYGGMKAGRVEICADQTAAEIITSQDGRRVTGIVSINGKTKKSHRFHSRTVAVCASTIDTASLLLQSKSRHHPHGLGNSSRQVGRNLMDHATVAGSGVVERFRDKPKLMREKCVSYLPRFQNLNGNDRGYLRGFGTQIIWSLCENLGDPRRDCSFLSASPIPHDFHFLMLTFGEVLSRPHNQVTLNHRKKNSMGLPVPHIDFRYSENETLMLKDQVRTMEALAQIAKLDFVVKPQVQPPGASIHEVGTARMGTNPQNSVLNPYNQCWDVPNLYVMDGSCFVSSGVQNPTLTMLAICNRACDHLVDSFKKGLFKTRS